MWQLAHKVMTDRQYEAFYLHVRRDLTPAQIAYELGISREAVRDRLEKGKRRLQAALHERKAA
jgi:DNA-directed RNA polymerase specialized sigma24 family protein